MQTRATYPNRAAVAELSVSPLTHHEMIRLVAPFARAGRHVDLARSDRSNRVITFKPVEHPAEPPVLAGLCETLQFENRHPDLYRLTRDLKQVGGLSATLGAEAPEPNDLLAYIEMIPPQSQFRSIAGVVVSYSYELRPEAGAKPQAALAAQLELVRAEAQVEGLTLTLLPRRVAGLPASIDLVPEAGRSFQLPEDLLAVLGGQWTILRQTAQGWRGFLLVRGGQRRRTRILETKFEQTVAHLSATLTEPPAQFHETLRRARWGVVLRRVMPLLIAVALMGGAWGLSFVHLASDSFVRFLLMSSPPVLLVAAFCLPNLPPIEIPKLPRRLSKSAWPQPPARDASD